MIKSFSPDETFCFLTLTKKGRLNIKNHKPTIGPQILTFSYSSSFNLTMDLSGSKKKLNIKTKQNMPPK